jgi:hypothetical protein
MKRILPFFLVACLAACLTTCTKTPEEIVPEAGNVPVWQVYINGLYAGASNLSSTFSVTLPTVTDFSAMEVIIKTDAQEAFVDGEPINKNSAILDLSSPRTLRLVKDGRTYQEYTLQARNTGLPVVWVETPGHKNITSKEDWMEGASLRIVQPDGTLDYEGAMSVRGRGNSTWNYVKKPYALKLEEKAEILSMPAHKRWVLLANWKDRTILRNDAAFWLSKHSGLPYTVRGQFVELVLNGVHKGNYYLCEQIKIDKARVNIDKKKGYLLEVDTYYDEPLRFRYSKLFNLPWMVKTPDADEITPEQYQYIQDWILNLETLLKDPAQVQAHAYEEFLDVDTAIDYLLVQELTTNQDFYNTWPDIGIHSGYLYMEPGGKLYTGPVWDFDFMVWVPGNTHSWQGANKTLFYPALLKDEKFRARLLERWNAQKDVFKGLPDYIDQMADYIRASEAINHAMWPINTNSENGDEQMTFQESVDRIKKAFLDKWTWMDQNISKLR